MTKQNKSETGIVLQKEYSIVSEKIKSLFNQPTPKEVIKRRMGRGGKYFDYVEVGYVVKKLNELFGPFWKFEIVDKGREGDQIWVLGRLTVYFSKDFSISKEQYGSATVKKAKDGSILSLGDDFKAASSDALKKCASLFGIAADVYFKNDESIRDEFDDVFVDEDPIIKAKKEFLKKKGIDTSGMSRQEIEKKFLEVKGK